MKLQRRSFLGALAGLSCGAFLPQGATSSVVANEVKSSSLSFDALKPKFSLNTATIREYNLSLIDELKVVKEAGYSHTEIWFDRLSDYARDDSSKGFAPKKLAELKKFLDGEGLRVEGGIGFATWIMNEEDKRKAGLDELKRQSEALAALGAGNIACPAAGPWNEKIEGIDVIAERFAQAIDVCASFGVRAMLELWGASPTLSRLSDCLAICVETGRSNAALLLDAYHLYRGGNSFDSLNLVAGSALPVFHMNDYPGTPEREKLSDSDRVFPGDGICPLRDVLATLYGNGFDGILSLELFNRKYAKEMSALDQAKTGLAKMRALFD